MRRIALAIAYDGTRFEGYARQPGHRTVEGELLDVLGRGRAIGDPRQARFRSGSRTDRGVSAAANVVAFDASLPPPAVVALTQRAPEGLHLLSAVEVAPDFEPRHARRRTYRYVLDEPWDWARVGPAARRFRGAHDFSNFRRADAGRPPAARVGSVRYRARPPGPWIEFTAPGFLWQQVRRMVGALQRVHDRRWSLQQIDDALHAPGRRVHVPAAPAENLLLVRVDYDSVTFPAAARVARARLERDASALRRRDAWLTTTLGNGPTTRR